MQIEKMAHHIMVDTFMTSWEKFIKDDGTMVNNLNFQDEFDFRKLLNTIRSQAINDILAPSSSQTCIPNTTYM